MATKRRYRTHPTRFGRGVVHAYVWNDGSYRLGCMLDSDDLPEGTVVLNHVVTCERCLEGNPNV